MIRHSEGEILNREGIPVEVVGQAYRDIARIHHRLGDTRGVIRAIGRAPRPVWRVLDVGCATGLVVHEVGLRLGVSVVGVEIKPHASISAAVSIVQADARCDRLPVADVAYCIHLSHHLSEDDLVAVIRNVGRSCRRFIILDLVRHPLPLGLFPPGIAPLVGRINAEDGRRSIQRSYTPTEFRRIAESALAGTRGTFRHSVAPFYIRQIIDISYGGSDLEDSHQWTSPL